MPTTPKGLRYPTADMADDVPLYLEQLAEDTDAALTVMVPSLAGLRALDTAHVTSARVFGVGDFAYDAAAAGDDDGLRVIKPTAGAGRWRLTVRPEEQGLGAALARIPDRRTGPFTILLVDDSIGSFDISPTQVAARQVQALYGAFDSVELPLGVYAGSYTSAGGVAGWAKQPFGGTRFTRLRGAPDAAVLPLPLGKAWDRFTLEYSTEVGGGVCDVLFDGVIVGNVDCGGAQAYRRKATFNAPGGYGYHSVSLQPRATGAPGAGNVYLEYAYTWRSDSTGVRVVDATLGGSALVQMQDLRGATGGQVDGIAIEPNVGIDSYFDRDDVHLILNGQLVNDAGTAGIGGYSPNFMTTHFRPLFDRAVAKTLARGVPLINVIQPGGHYSDPAYGLHDSFEAIREYYLDIGRRFGHVFAVDWHGLTVESDMITYAAKYYPSVTAYDSATHTYGGDFIHPNAASMRQGTAALCALLGINPPDYDLASVVFRAGLARFRTDLPAHDADSPFRHDRTDVVLEGRRKQLRPVGVATNDLTGQRKPYFYDDSVANFSDFPSRLAASVRSDKYGPYLRLNNENYSFTMSVGDRRTITGIGRMIPGQTAMSFRSAGFRFRVNGVLIPLDDSGRSDYRVEFVTEPTAFTIDIECIAAYPIVQTFGDFYAFSVTDTAGAAILSLTELSGYRRIGPPSPQPAAEPYDDRKLGQSFYSVEADASLVQKRLVSDALEWDLVAGAFKRVGVYQAADRADVALAQLFTAFAHGTKVNEAAGGYGEYDGSGAHYEFDGLDIRKRRTLLTRLMAYDQLEVRLTNLATNAKRYLDSTYAWVAPQSYVHDWTTLGGSGPYVGENLSIPLDVAQAVLDAIGTNTPEVRLTWVAGGGFAPGLPAATLGRGLHPLI